jgi:hypothetical protein
MLKLDVFDPAMCCSTGVCGPSVDPVLPRFAADLEWVRAQGVDVQRHNLAHQAGDFVANAVVRKTLAEQGEGCLPLVLLDGRIVAQRVYPSRRELAEVLLTDAPADPGSAHTSEKPRAAGRVIPVRSSGGRCC